MTTRYVVLVKPPDDHPAAARIMGTFFERDRAEQLATTIQAAVEREEGDTPFSPSGYAWVIELEEPRVRSAVRWATRGES